MATFPRSRKSNVVMKLHSDREFGTSTSISIILVSRGDSTPLNKRDNVVILRYM